MAIGRDSMTTSLATRVRREGTDRGTRASDMSHVANEPEERRGEEEETPDT